MDSGDEDAQMKQIQAEKAALTWQMYGMILLSLLVASAFYGITILQNPALKPTSWATWQSTDKMMKWLAGLGDEIPTLRHWQKEGVVENVSRSRKKMQ